MTGRRVLVGATLLFTALGLAWWFGGRRPEARAVRPGVTVRVNMERRLVITPGTPLQIEVSLGSAPGAPGFRMGGRWRPWHEYVHLEDPTTGRGAPWPLQVVSATSFAIERGPEGSRGISTTGRVAHLEGGHQVHTVTLVAAPAGTAQAAPGLYRFRAVVQIPAWHLGGWRGRAVSAPVTITVRARDDGKEGIEDLEKQRLRYASKYYLSVGQVAEATRAAKELLARGTDDPATHILLGDVLLADNHFGESLAEYRRALALLPRSYEEPTLLLERIARVSERTR